MNDEWSGDPFANPDDPAAREREERRLEREEKRRKREAKQGEKKAKRDKRAAPAPVPAPSEPAEPAPAAQSPVTPVPAPAEPEPPAEPPLPPPPPRTPEQEFWDEPADEPGTGEGPAAAAAATEAEIAWNEPREQSWEAPDEGLPPEQTAAGAGAGRSRRGSGSGGDGVLARIGRHPFRIIAAIFALLVVWFLFALFQPFHGDGTGKVAVTIPKGASVSEVGDLLGEKGVIDSSTLFQVRATLGGQRSELFPGHYTLAHGMSYGAALDALSTPPVKRVVSVTIPEGYSRSQAAQLVEEDGLPGSYTKATVKSPFLSPAKYGGKGAKDLEGFLFPDSFELKSDAPVGDLVQLQLEDFKRRIKGVDMSYAKKKNLTVFDVLIIASMIEREAGIPSQRKLVASVVYNRLHEGMPLGIDATIRFATGNYTRPLTESELAVDSPYNTRTNQGLPPGPINSPGLASIEAAAHPAKSDYLFYVNKPNTCGGLSFSANEAEFESDVAKYNAAREANGGNEPSSCGE